MNVVTKFVQALKLNLNSLLKSKGKVEYLPWASALGEFKKIYPNGNFTFVKNENGGFVFEERIPDISDSEATDKVIGYFVEVTVTDGEETPIEHTLTLPIMDYHNKANMNFTVMDVNKAQWRCLTKGFALFGIGLTTYAGEEYYQYEVGEELDKAKAEILEYAKAIITLDESKRIDVVNIIGNKGRPEKIKDIEEATDKKEKLIAFLAKLEKEANTKTTKKTTTTKTTKTEKEEK